MENERNFRSLVPPLVFVASLVWANLLESGWDAFQSDEIGASIAALLAGGAAVVVAVGFVLSSVSVWLLEKWSRWKFGRTIDIAGFTDETLAAFGKSLGISRDWALKFPLQVAALYDHGEVRQRYPGVHEWAGRRWNMFYVSVHCCLALVFAHVWWLAYHLGRGSTLHLSWTMALCWWLPDLFLVACMGANACRAFRQNRDLFAVVLELRPKATDPTACAVGTAAELRDGAVGA